MKQQPTHEINVEKIVDFIIEDGTQNTTSSNWNTDFSDIEEKFAISDLASNHQLLEEIENELWGREEVLDFEIDMECQCFDNVYGTDFCPSYDPYLGHSPDNFSYEM